jgi:ketosteroid isomerase-like protein
MLEQLCARWNEGRPLTDLLSLAELDELWRCSYDAERLSVLDAALRYAQATTDGDPDALAEAVTDDCVLVDHRPLGKGRISRTALVAAVRSRPDVMGVERAVALTIHRVDGAVLVMTAAVVGRAPSGLEYEETRIQVWRVRRGRVAAIEIFGQNDLDLALERGHELAES